jgi:hypothetical protein
MNLGGVLGAVAGSGLGVLAHLDDGRAWAATVGITSLIGAGIAVHVTADEPGIRPERSVGALGERTRGWTLEPLVSVRRTDTGTGKSGTLACIGFMASF